jgi:hypothetical protein
MAGFGDKLLAHLKTVPQATTEELAKLAGVSLEQAYSRLMALSYEKRTVSAGKGKNRAWSLPGGEPVAISAPADKPALAGNRNHGWKPSLARFEPVLDTPKVGAKLLVEYPEEWRHSALVAVSREPNAEGASLCWDIRNKMCTFVPVEPEAAAKHGVKLAYVSREKDLIALENDG